MSNILVFSADSHIRTADKNNLWVTPFIRVGNSMSNAIIRADLAEDNANKYWPQISEGLALYYVWKHLAEFGNPKYVGFCHYRRFFMSANLALKTVEMKDFDEWKTLILTPATQAAVLDKNKSIGILPRSFTSKYTILEKAAVEWKHHNVKVPIPLLQAAIELLLQCVQNPYKQYIIEACNEKVFYHCNISTLRRDIFEQYCAALFKAIFYLIDHIDSYVQDRENLDPRYAGYIMERLSSLFFSAIEKGGGKFLKAGLLNPKDY